MARTVHPIVTAEAAAAGEQGAVLGRFHRVSRVVRPHRFAPSGRDGYRRGMWLRIVALVCLVALTGCPRKRHTLVPSVPTSGDAEARARFLDARARFLRDGSETPDPEEFRAIAAEYPGDPIEPFALLFAGMAAQQAGDATAAAASLDRLLAIDPLESGLRQRGELYLGLARGLLGEHDRALPLLAGSEPAVETDAERGAWIAALAHAHAASPTPLAALPWIDRWWAIATPAERAFLRGRLEQLVAGVGAEEADLVWRTLEGAGPSVAVLGWRVAADRDAAGDSEGARGARDRARPVRRAIGLAAGADSAGPPRPGVIGAIVPQSARQARLGDQLAQGLQVGARSLGEMAPTIQIEDGEGAAAADAVAALGGRHVVAILGPTDGASVDAAARRAAELSMPLLSFNPRAEEHGGGTYVFHVMHSAEARARALVRRAARLGIKRFAVLRPETGYGTAVTRAFRAEVAAVGGEIVVDRGYPADTRSFAAIAKKLSGGWQAVFVPDQADRLELIAPALAAAGFIARPAGWKKKVPGGRAVVLMSTAEGAGDGFVREAARYAEGGLLAPGYFPGALDEAGLEFERLYFEATGKTPTAVDAYAYDAVRLVAGLGVTDRGELARRLATAEVAGVTGALRFDPDHRRADDGVIYTVVMDDGQASVKPLP
jgi:ABC-type branched-subunit amino acid transport system substrate-binding protein